MDRAEIKKVCFTVEITRLFSSAPNRKLNVVRLIFLLVFLVGCATKSIILPVTPTSELANVDWCVVWLDGGEEAWLYASVLGNQVILSKEAQGALIDGNSSVFGVNKITGLLEGTKVTISDPTKLGKTYGDLNFEERSAILHFRFWGLKSDSVETYHWNQRCSAQQVAGALLTLSVTFERRDVQHDYENNQSVGKTLLGETFKHAFKFILFLGH